MPKFFQVEKAAYAGEKDTFSNVKFKKSNTESSNAAEAGTILEIIPMLLIYILFMYIIFVSEH